MAILHQPEQCRFIYQADGAEARLDYRLLASAGRPAVDFYHTFVPPAFRGQGIAAALTAAGLDWARQQQLEIYASCSYVAVQLRR
jgi:predicted GNAT family acetyltransferase